MSWLDDDSRGKDSYGLVPGEEVSGFFDHLRMARWKDWVEAGDTGFEGWEPPEPWYVTEAAEEKRLKKLLAEQKRKLRGLAKRKKPTDNTLSQMFLDKLDSPGGREKIAEFGRSYIRDHLREVAFTRDIVPPVKVTKNDAKPSIHHDTLVMVEPESRAIAITFRGQERGAPIKKG